MTHYGVDFALLDVLGEIYREISFSSSPEERDRQGAEVRQTVRETGEPAPRAARPS